MRGKPITHEALSKFLGVQKDYETIVHITQIKMWLEGGDTVTLANGTKLKANKKRTLFHSFKEVTQDE